MAVQVTPLDIKLHGVYAEDVAYLRDIGHVVAPFKGGYRIDNEVVEKPGLQVFARKQREKRGDRQPAARAALVSAALAPIIVPPVVAPPSASAGLCGCGRPASHPGRCSHRRELNDPVVKPKRAPSSDHLVARVDQLERQVRALARILGATLRGDRLALEGRAHTLGKIEVELAHL